MKTKTNIARLSSGPLPMTVPIVGWSVDVPCAVRIRHQPGAIPAPIRTETKAVKQPRSTWAFTPTTARKSLQQTM